MGVGLALGHRTPCPFREQVLHELVHAGRSPELLGGLPEPFEVLRLFVRRGFFDEDQAEGMLQWPHSGFHVHTGVGVSAADRPFALRLARYCARNPMAPDGPTAGTAALDPLVFLIRVR